MTGTIPAGARGAGDPQRGDHELRRHREDHQPPWRKGEKRVTVATGALLSGHVCGSQARNNELAVEDMDGGTFTISNGGVFGSMFGTPIINPPQSAILGMHGIFQRPVAINGKVGEKAAVPRETEGSRVRGVAGCAGGDPAHDVRGPDLRSPARGRQGGGHLPAEDQSGGGRSPSAAAGHVMFRSFKSPLTRTRATPEPKHLIPMEDLQNWHTQTSDITRTRPAFQMNV